MLYLKRLVSLFIIMCMHISFGMSPKKNLLPRLINPTKKTERLWSDIEDKNPAAFIHHYIQDGGNLQLTNEYGENAIKVLIKSATLETTCTNTQQAH